ncbi:MAG: hypothetical protein IKT30_06845 [Bacteroidaceae bacterium]|nr:hypothetical protein [Bacteroidaceae bacterium]
MVKVKLNLPGLNELMTSPEISQAVLEAGQAVAQAAGPEYAAEVHTANWIAISNVYPDSKEAAHENFKDNTLLKAIGSVGLKQSK